MKAAQDVWSLDLPDGFLWILLVGGSLSFGFIAVWLGHDLSWDLLNYHYYNPHALLTGRYELDVAPAQLQSYFNPLVDVPFYLLIKAFPAPAVGFAAGAFQGLNFSLVFVLTWMLVDHRDALIRGAISLGSAIVGCFAPAYMGELGTLVHDSTLSVFVLASLALLLPVILSGSCASNPRCGLWVFFAGFLMGTATALKLPNAMFALSSVLALSFLSSLRGRLIRILLVYVSAGILAGMVFLAPWMWFLWDLFGNPLFPFRNDLFQSPAAAPYSFADLRFMPRAWWEYPLWPLIFSEESRRVWEVDSQDYRFAALWCVGVAYGLKRVLGRFVPRWAEAKGERSDVTRSAGNFLLLFTLFSFVLWMLQFSIYRYLTPLELIAPLVFGLIIARLGISRRHMTGLVVVMGIASIVAMRAPNQKRQAWDINYFEVDAKVIPRRDETIILMLGQAPMAYVIPDLPPELRFLRPEGNLSLRESDGLMKRIRSIIEAHTGSIFALYEARDGSVSLADSLIRLGLTSEPGECTTLETNVPDDLRLCAVAKANKAH